VIAIRRRAPSGPLLLSALLIAVIVLRLVMVVGAIADPAELDIGRFWQIAQSSGRPYVTYQVEYPPLMLALFKLLGLGGSMHALGAGVAVLNALADAAIAVVLLRTWGRRAAVIWLVAALPLEQLLLSRLDLMPAACAVAAVAAVTRRRPALAGVLLATGAGFKLWPAILVPLLWNQLPDRTSRWRLAGGFAITGGLILVGWLLLAGPQGIVEVVTLRGAHGVQIESVSGSLIRVINGAHPFDENEAFRVAAPSWIPLAGISAAGALLALLVGLRSRGPASLAAAWVGAVGLLIASSSVFSPQYAVWLLPAAVLAWEQGERGISALVIAIAGLTMLDADWYAAVLAGSPVATGVLLLRNLLLLAAVIVCVVRVLDTRRGTSPRHAESVRLTGGAHQLRRMG
jgi:uncharacterized membrane protein